jgi:hypothetical protein
MTSFTDYHNKILSEYNKKAMNVSIEDKIIENTKKIIIRML